MSYKFFISRGVVMDMELKKDFGPATTLYGNR